MRDLQASGRRVLVRADLNVPVADGRVTDATRIRATLPTLRHLLGCGAAVIVMSHRGRPKGKVVADLSMRPAACALAEELGVPVPLAADCVGASVRRAAGGLRPGQVLMLENLRFHPGETSNDPELGGELASLGDLYVDDAFGACHRRHASIVAAAEASPQAAAGDLLQREVTMLSRVLIQPVAPFVLVLGGAKVADKIGVITNLLPIVDRIVIGGAMANAFLAAQGRCIGDSLAPQEAVAQAQKVLQAAAEARVELILPSDLVAAPGPQAGVAAHVVTDVAEDEMALDIGPHSRQRFADALADAHTVVWNGPMGVFEDKAFGAGTKAVAESIARLGGDAFTVIGGGDTVAAAAMAGITHRVSHVSTGGGASLELLAGLVLPGVAALTRRAGPDVGEGGVQR